MKEAKIKQVGKVHQCPWPVAFGGAILCPRPPPCGAPLGLVRNCGGDFSGPPRPSASARCLDSSAADRCLSRPRRTALALFLLFTSGRNLRGTCKSVLVAFRLLAKAAPQSLAKFLWSHDKNGSFADTTTAPTDRIIAQNRVVQHYAVNPAGGMQAHV